MLVRSIRIAKISRVHTPEKSYLNSWPALSQTFPFRSWHMFRFLIQLCFRVFSFLNRFRFDLWLGTSLGTSLRSGRCLDSPANQGYQKIKTDWSKDITLYTYKSETLHACLALINTLFKATSALQSSTKVLEIFFFISLGKIKVAESKRWLQNITCLIGIP